MASVIPAGVQAVRVDLARIAFLLRISQLPAYVKGFAVLDAQGGRLAGLHRSPPADRATASNTCPFIPILGNSGTNEGGE